MREKQKNAAGLQGGDEYQNTIHRIGRIGLLLMLVYSAAMPFILVAVYDCMPSIKQLLLGAGAIMLAFTPSALAEVFTYTPILGSSSYITFLTGNISNLKFPCAMNAMKIAKVDQNTEEADAISLVAICVSSILTMVIIAIGALALTPLKPFLEHPAVTVASNYILPALFGNLIYNIMFKDTGTVTVKKKALIPIMPLVVVGGLVISGILNVAYAMLLLIVVVPLNLLVSKKLFEKHILTVEKIGGSSAAGSNDSEETENSAVTGA